MGFVIRYRPELVPTANPLAHEVFHVPRWILGLGPFETGSGGHHTATSHSGQRTRCQTFIIGPMSGVGDVHLIDFGDAARLEQFGERLVDRPHPGAFGARREPEAWPSADLRFDRDGGWSGPAADAGPWTTSVAGLRLELRATAGGQVGLFPEHAAMLPWLEARISDRVGAGDPLGPPAVLHLFAYTGLATLAIAGLGRGGHPRGRRQAIGRVGTARTRPPTA